MATSFIVSAAKIGIVLEQNTQTLSGTHISAVGALYDAASDPTYAVISFNTDVAIETFGYEHETFQTNEDHYDHYVDLRYTGAGSITSVAIDDTGSGLDAYNVLYAATHFPNGDCNSTTGNDLAWDPVGDTNGGSKANDLRGYGIIIEKQVSASVFYWWIFHNARIEATPSFAPKQATRLNLRWMDARIVDVSTSASTFTDHIDS
jgi:hypothetical protein